VTTVAVLQPGYLPWIGYFELMRSADVFVLYDDVQFDKHGWRNRNRVKCEHGAQWLTVPVRHHGLGGQRILDVEVDASRSWARKHLATIRQCYARAPHLEPYASELEQLLERSWERLVDLDVAVAGLLAGWLRVESTTVRSSELDVAGSRSERLVEICRRFDADRYRSGEAAREYLDVELFGRSGIAVEWQNLAHPVYPQLHDGFVSHLSALDLVLNCGEDSAAVLAAARTRQE
jgi:WbqC-like protein family